jgi:RHS repeat-associated protein
LIPPGRVLHGAGVRGYKLNEITQYAATPVLYDHGNNAGGPFPTRGNGNITDDGVRTYGYDAMNRLTTVQRKSDGAIIGQYTYDATGRRIRKVVSNGGLSGTIANNTYRYISESQQIVEELLVGGSTTTLRQFIWGQYIDEFIQMKTYASTGSQPLPAGAYYLHSSLLYRPVALTHASDAIVEAYETDAYGNTLIYSEPGPDSTWFTNDDVQSDQPACEIVFCGYRFDPETQIYHVRARPYVPMLGRFIARDQLAYIDGPNLYQYARSAPTGFLDPFGNAIRDEILKGCSSLNSAGVNSVSVQTPPIPALGGVAVYGTATFKKSEKFDCCCDVSLELGLVYDITNKLTGLLSTLPLGDDLADLIRFGSSGGSVGSD